MKSVKGNVGRVFVLKFDHGDDFLAELDSFVKKEQVKSGIIQFIGALNNSDVVVGPKENTVPPEPMWKHFDDSREVLGIGTIFWKDDEPKVHIHGSLGKGDDVNLGCVRKNTNVYLIIEAVVFEIEGINAKRFKDEKTGLDILELS